MAGTILYVDDEHAVQRAISRDLRAWLDRRHLDLKTFDSAAACLKFLESGGDDVVLVVSDLRMPGMKGSELLQVLAQRYPNIGLLLLTAYSDMEEIRRAVAARIYGLVMKPWDPDSLTAELDRALSLVEQRRGRMRHQFEIENQLQIAGDFQNRLFEVDLPHSERFTIEATSRPADGTCVNGDYYDVVQLDDNRLLLLVADVSGHGVKPAFMATALKLLVDDERAALSRRSFRVADLLDRLNRELVRRFSATAEMLVSFSALLIELDQETAQFVSAGNPPLFLVRGARVQRIGATCPALGFSTDVEYEQVELPIYDGDRFVLFTDGLYDRGLARSISMDLLAAAFLQADALGDFLPHVERLMRADSLLRGEDRARIQHDDLTILTVKLRSTHGRN